MIDGRVVLAFSGGESSAEALALLRRSSAEVVAVVVDVGQERAIHGIRQHAMSLGAMRVHVIDARDEFLDRHVLPALQLGVLADPGAAADPALLHPLVARTACEIAVMEDASTIAHGAPAGTTAAGRMEQLMTGCGFDGLVRPAFERSSPASSGSAFATAFARVLRGSGGLPSSNDRSAYVLTRDPGRAPGSASVAITFSAGRPTAVNGVSLSLAELIEVITTIAGDHGIGRIASVDPALDRWTVAEAPAAVVLSAAFTALSTATAGADAVAARSALAPSWRLLLDRGRWHAPVREAIDAFLASMCSTVSGVAQLDLQHGECLVGRADAERPQRVAALAPHRTH